VPNNARRRPTRPRHARLGLLAIVASCAALLAVPGTAPRGDVLDLVGDAVAGPATVSGLEPTPGESPAPGSPIPSAEPAPNGSPASDMRPAAARHGRVPERTIFEATAPTAPPIESLVDYVWPIAHPRLTLPFGPSSWGSRLVNGQPFHDGVDLATFCGDRIVAAHAGTVLAAGRHYDQVMGWIGDLGPYLARLDAKHLWMTLPILVVIDDGNGYRSMYAHFGRIVVSTGQVVKAGQLIGYEGATGRASGCHLHYGLFSPWEWGRFGILPDVAARMKLPPAEIARIDPLLVLPPKPGINAPAMPKPSSKVLPVPIAAP
jgi:murein DD-endopeptidase MepM/ murein hydrolase activator NlpD